MSVWSLTKTEISGRIESLVRRLLQTEVLTYQDRKIISDAINAAMVDIVLDYGVSRWRFMQSNETVSTTSGTNYVNLTSDIFGIVSGTARIEAESTSLSPTTVEVIIAGDTGREVNGRPEKYALDSSGTANTVRLLLWPIPDAVYTISFVAEKMIDEDSISSFPTWMHAALKDKSTENALRDLGLADASMPFANSYANRKQQAKNKENPDVPMHIGRTSSVVHTNIQSRAT